MQGECVYSALPVIIIRLGVTLAVDVVVCTHECVYPVGRRPQSAGYEQFGGGSRAAGSVIRLVHWKNAQVTYSAWSRARTPAAVFFHVTFNFKFCTKTAVQCCRIGQFSPQLSYFLFNWAGCDNLGCFLYHLGSFQYSN